MGRALKRSTKTPGADSFVDMERRTATRDDEGALTQRVRIGLTGLGCVFLLVLLAASLFGFVGDNGPSAPGQVADNGATAANAEADAPKEPLAELGVAPGNAPDHPIDNDSAMPAEQTRPRATPAAH